MRYVSWALEHEEVSPKDVTLEWLEKKRDSTPGVVTLVLLKALLVSHIRDMAAELPEEGHMRKEMQKVRTFAVSPQTSATAHHIFKNLHYTTPE